MELKLIDKNGNAAKKGVALLAASLTKL